MLYASVVEFIHTATLVHDDIIDGADLRRGRLAVHSRWGNDITVLLGDYLYIKSMAMALTQDSLEIIRLLCDVTLRMIEGELYQLTKTGDVDITEDEHFEIIRRKTAFLFGGCAQIGGMLGGVTRGAAKPRCATTGSIWASPSSSSTTCSTTPPTQAALGKPVGGDLREGKVTLPIILLLAARRRRGRSPDPRRGRDRTVAPDQWRDILRLLQRAPGHGTARTSGASSMPRARRVACPRSHQAASATRCWPFPTTSFRDR